ncbi:hypothetical protein BC833DRAFT_627330 [Globomyces pollinis-pini]|nr:hypothetical protein BC833DRAFT_627330 [Globomyces pollinis-pini]
MRGVATCTWTGRSDIVYLPRRWMKRIRVPYINIHNGQKSSYWSSKPISDGMYGLLTRAPAMTDTAARPVIINGWDEYSIGVHPEMCRELTTSWNAMTQLVHSDDMSNYNQRVANVGIVRIKDVATSKMSVSETYNMSRQLRYPLLSVLSRDNYVISSWSPIAVDLRAMTIDGQPGTVYRGFPGARILSRISTAITQSTLDRAKGKGTQQSNVAVLDMLKGNASTFVSLSDQGYSLSNRAVTDTSAQVVCKLHRPMFSKSGLVLDEFQQCLLPASLLFLSMDADIDKRAVVEFAYLLYAASTSTLSKMDITSTSFSMFLSRTNACIIETSNGAAIRG